MIQPMVEWHHENVNDPQSSSQARYTNETRTSEVLNNLVLENHESLKVIEKNFINYTSFREVYDCSTTTTNICFSIVIAENFINDTDPKTMADGEKHWTRTTKKKQLKLSLTRLRK
jgi:hypothetical protein